MLTRRDLLKAGLLGGVGLLAPRWDFPRAWADGPPLLDPLSHPKFVNPLPTPGVIDATAGGFFEVPMTQFMQWLGLVDNNGQPLMTPVWGYQGTYPGPTIHARKDVPVSIRWKNALLDGAAQPLPHLLPVDTSIHWANPAGWPGSGVPVVTHVHGGHTESASDGLPEAWFTPGFARTGATWVKETYAYDNDQEAATLWYHDHALGITRLNVYAGLAGFYLLRDENEDSLNLPSGPYEREIVIQDRMFTADGQLLYPFEPEEHEAPEPSVLPEFFGDFILVNGLAWPYLDVEPRKYRFRLLNGSDSRFYSLRITAGAGRGTGPMFYQIGADDGLLYAPVPLNQLTLGPGERADVVVDFAGSAGETLIVRNNARAPYPKGDTVNPKTAGLIMAFRVGASPVVDTSDLPSVLRPSPFTVGGTVAATRQLILFEGQDEFGRLQPALGTVGQGRLMWDEAITENPGLNDVEVWEVYNATEDAHPIHLHLVSFEILDRQKFRADIHPLTGALSNIRKLGRPKPPETNEFGPKDTAQMFPGEVTRVKMRFDRPGRYVWHCHILSHEDHEMMRPYEVGP